MLVDRVVRAAVADTSCLLGSKVIIMYKRRLMDTPDPTRAMSAPMRKWAPWSTLALATPKHMLTGRTKVAPKWSPILDIPIPAYRVGELEQGCDLGPNNEHGCPHITRSCLLGQGVAAHIILINNSPIAFGRGIAARSAPRPAKTMKRVLVTPYIAH